MLLPGDGLRDVNFVVLLCSFIAIVQVSLFMLLIVAAAADGLFLLLVPVAVVTVQFLFSFLLTQAG